MGGAVLERVLVEEAIQVVRQGTRHFRRATRARTVGEALHPLVSKAMDPFAERGIGKVQRVRDGLEALPSDDIPDGLGAPEDTGCLRLL
jgi:hypothetical protein